MRPTSSPPRQPSIVHAILDGALAWPQRPALVFGEEVLTYADLVDHVRRAAGWLEEAGVGRGTKVAVLTPNEPMAVVAAIAALHVGAVWVPVNPRDPVRDIAAMLQRVDCDVLLHGLPMATEAAEVEALLGELPLVADLAVLRSGVPTRRAIEARPDDVAAIFFTGGTTGLPKGVVFRHRNLAALAEGYVELMVEQGDVALAAGPLTHAAGRQCLASLTGGITTVVLPAFEAGEVLRVVEEQQVTFTTVTPTMLAKLLDHPDVLTRDHSSLRCLGYGAAPISLSRLKEAIHVFGPVLQGVYGQTESPMIIACLRPEEHLHGHELADDARLLSVGRPTRFSEVRIVGADGSELPVGEIGEIVVAGDYQMSGYYDAPELTEAARWGRFIRTGDLGFLDEEGFLTIRGRRKDMIITGGFNVYAAEVENALASHPDVGEVAVLGMPDPVWGEAVTAVVAARPGRRVDVPALSAWSRARLGGVKSPKRIEVLPDLPRNTNGKVLKRALRDLLELAPPDRRRP